MFDRELRHPLADVSGEEDKDYPVRAARRNTYTQMGASLCEWRAMLTELMTAWYVRVKHKLLALSTI